VSNPKNNEYLDEVIITVQSGRGGDGCVSFRRERYVPRGGPDGGDGGRGGDVRIRADARLHTLIDYRYKRFFKAEDGAHGRGKNQKGRDGRDLVLRVPVGTVIHDLSEDSLVADLVSDAQEVILLRGGRGGRGNFHFKSPTHRAPRKATLGEEGKRRKFRLSLKVLADVGIVGFPNAGKSTLLSRITNARPKIGEYPFTTIIPNLGVIEYEDGSSLRVADIPGLIEDASKGKGLGHRFLKHIQRTSLLIYLLDISFNAHRGGIEDFHILRKEVENYDPRLLNKDMIVVINKIDLESSKKRDLDMLLSYFRGLGIYAIPISAMKCEGIEELKEFLRRHFFNGR